MSLKLLFSLLALAGASGVVIGYLFRWLWVLARKGSIELEVKQIILNARQEAAKVAEEGARKSAELLMAAEHEL